MFYWLIELSNTVPGFAVFRGLLNVFRYITFRTGGAMVTGALFVFLFGPWIIDHLRLRQGKGQPIRTDGPASHIVAKKGTPTMGGLMILSGVVVSTLLWANPRRSSLATRARRLRLRSSCELSRGHPRQRTRSRSGAKRCVGGWKSCRGTKRSGARSAGTFLDANRERTKRRSTGLEH